MEEETGVTSKSYMAHYPPSFSTPQPPTTITPDLLLGWSLLGEGEGKGGKGMGGRGGEGEGEGMRKEGEGREGN